MSLVEVLVSNLVMVFLESGGRISSGIAGSLVVVALLFGWACERQKASLQLVGNQDHPHLLCLDALWNPLMGVALP